jgi:hypothetical protein
VAEDAAREARYALHSWFELTRPDERSLLDLNHLAHALWGAHRFTDATRVFEALGPYCTPLPWAYRTSGPAGRGQAVEVFMQARARSRAAARDPGPSS